jgi:hypothetical protein
MSASEHEPATPDNKVRSMYNREFPLNKNKKRRAAAVQVMMDRYVFVSEKRQQSTQG